MDVDRRRTITAQHVNSAEQVHSAQISANVNSVLRTKYLIPLAAAAVIPVALELNLYLIIHFVLIVPLDNSPQQMERVNCVQ